MRYMPLSVVVFSAENVRGALLRKALEKSGFEVSLHKNVRVAINVLKAKAPQLVIIDRKGYFPRELESFSSLSDLLKNIPVVIVSKAEADSSFTLKDVSVEWCQSDPLDPLAVVAKAKSSLAASGKSDLREKETIAEDLRGFIGLK